MGGYTHGHEFVYFWMIPRCFYDLGGNMFLTVSWKHGAAKGKTKTILRRHLHGDLQDVYERALVRLCIYVFEQ